MRVLAFVQFPGSSLASSVDRNRASASYAPGRCCFRAQLGGPQSSDEEDEENDEVTELSRRVFTLSVGATGLFTFIQAFRLFASDELKHDVVQPFRKVLPSVFETTEDTRPPSARREPVNAKFARFFFDSHADIADELGILKRSQLKMKEEQILAQSISLFFPKNRGVPDLTVITDPMVYNYRLYARVRAIADLSSPLSRRAFTRRLGGESLRYIEQDLNVQNRPLPSPERAKKDPRAYTSEWLGAMDAVLAALVQLGWISSYRIADFDQTPGSVWSDEGRGALTVYCDDPLTLDTAMLIGEEHFDEISPKVGSILYCLLCEYGLTDVSYEDYYLDLMYRPDPAEYKPRQIVSQFNFTAAATTAPVE